MDERKIVVIRVFEGGKLIDIIKDESGNFDIGKYKGRKDLEYAVNFIFKDDVKKFEIAAACENESMLKNNAVLIEMYSTMIKNLEKKALLI